MAVELNPFARTDISMHHTSASLADLLSESAAQHRHLCPKQVLGVRMGMLGRRRLGLGVSDADKRLLVIVETDGCAADGVSAATGCTVGHRTLRVVDYGKVAASFVDTQSGQAVRIVPHRDSREAALRCAPWADSAWRAQLEAYQFMPDEELFVVRRVELTASIERILSKPGCLVVCDRCGEEIFNEREIVHNGDVLCRACAGEAYYRPG
jgi:formylmethanofuran dehydrogenase subunit E